MANPNYRRSALQMLLAYAVVHITLTVLTAGSGHALSAREHLTAVNWAIPGLLVCWLALRPLARLYRMPKVRALLLAPFVGMYLQLLLALLPLAAVAATIIGVGESLHKNSLWALFAILGISAAMMSAQRTLIQQFAAGEGTRS